MPSSLPDPVLALSMTNVQKLKDVDVDQLANLWNVFTKCKESLESGRRLENLSWRLWFREAHLLPPDVSLSDITDYTPLDTPLMSRRGSVTGSYSTANRNLAHAISHPTIPVFSNSISERVIGAAESLSDPEDGDWSSDDDDDVDESKAGSVEKTDEDARQVTLKNRGRLPVRKESSSPEIDTHTVTNQMLQSTERKAVRSSTTSSRAGPTPSSSTLAAPQHESRAFEGPAILQLGTTTPTNGDRKRAVSSSSAFGSRARVKQHNTNRRRRPLSFQQAIESLLFDRSKDFKASPGTTQNASSDSTLQSQSLQNGKRIDVGVDTNKNEGEDWQSDVISNETHRGAEMIGIVQQSSAPAEFSQPNTPSVTIASPKTVYTALPSASRHKTESPVAFIKATPKITPNQSSKSKEANEDCEKNTKAEEKKSKFFMAGQSVEDEDEDEWSSASSTDSEEMRKREVAQRRKKAEREMEMEKKQKEKEKAKMKSLFQKVPIKSASTVDVRTTGRRRSSAPMQGTEKEEVDGIEVQQAPIRGLLSSLFHPEEGPHPPPGQLAGRPHASAADLRQRPQRLSNHGKSKMKEKERKKGLEGSPSKLTRVPSTTQVPSIGSGVLKLSKSAVALPVLSTMGSRSTAKSNAVSSRDSAVFDDEDDEGEEHDSGEMEGCTEEGAREEEGESEALARLNRLAHKKERQRQGKKTSLSSAKNETKMKRQLNHSLNIEVSPEVRDEEMMRQRREASGSKTLPMPSSTSQRTSSSSHIPETSIPQTPRTTRRNMIRDELSESIRQNLLWERQSRHRMLGIGALGNTPTVQKGTIGSNSSTNTTTTKASELQSRSQMPPPPAPLLHRNHSVLGGGQLKPLTSSNSVVDVSQQHDNNQQEQHQHRDQHREGGHYNAPHRTYTGDFHHAGW